MALRALKGLHKFIRRITGVHLLKLLSFGIDIDIIRQLRDIKITSVN